MVAALFPTIGALSSSSLVLKRKLFFGNFQEWRLVISSRYTILSFSSSSSSYSFSSLVVFLCYHSSNPPPQTFYYLHTHSFTSYVFPHPPTTCTITILVFISSLIPSPSTLYHSATSKPKKPIQTLFNNVITCCPKFSCNLSIGFSSKFQRELMNYTMRLPYNVLFWGFGIEYLKNY